MKLSVFLPTIRTHLLEEWYSSLEKSCDRHDFEVVLCGPFDIPSSLSKKENINFIKDFGNPTRAAQIAAINCKGDYVYHTTDDVVFFPNIISQELDQIKERQIIAMRYREGQDHLGDKLDPSYWFAPNAYAAFPGVDDRWGICVHFLMERSLFLKYGGFDCRWQYLNHAGHDLLFRIQQNEGVQYCLSQSEASSADWMPNTTGDHAPIHHAQLQDDEPLFQREWFFKNDRGVIELENYKSQPDVWKKRFRGTEERYSDL